MPSFLTSFWSWLSLTCDVETIEIHICDLWTPVPPSFCLHSHDSQNLTKKNPWKLFIKHAFSLLPGGCMRPVTRSTAKKQPSLPSRAGTRARNAVQKPTTSLNLRTGPPRRKQSQLLTIPIAPRFHRSSSGSRETLAGRASKWHRLRRASRLLRCYLLPAARVLSKGPKVGPRVKSRVTVRGSIAWTESPCRKPARGRYEIWSRPTLRGAKSSDSTENVKTLTVSWSITKIHWVFGCQWIKLCEPLIPYDQKGLTWGSWITKRSQLSVN